MNVKSALPYLLMASMFVIINGLALLFVNALRPVASSPSVAAFSDPSNPWDVVYLLGTMLAFTGIILYIKKHRKHNIKLFSNIFLLLTVFVMINFLYLLYSLFLPFGLALILTGASQMCFSILLLKYPEWYIIDAVGVMVAVYSATLMGISLSTFLVIALLGIVAVYDAISVYKTKHMISLADVVINSKTPLILFFPKVRGFSLMKETNQQIGEGGKRRVFYIGLGDFMFPTILATSAFYLLDNLWISASVLLGTLLGFSVLMRFVLKGKTQAGLPFLCSGAVLGYIISNLIFFGKILL